jgi:hypothetical protein
MKTKTLHLIAVIREEVGTDPAQTLADFIAKAFSAYEGGPVALVPVIGVTVQDTPFTEEDIENAETAIKDSWINIAGEGIVQGVEFYSSDDLNRKLNP